MKNEKTILGKTVADKTMADNRTAAGTKSDNGQLSEGIAAEWKEGDVILDTYEVLDLLGEGGMAKVFKVHHKGWNAELAMKCALPELFASQAGKEAFVHEAEAWSNLGLHPNIAYCYYVRSIQNIPHVFAEFVEGGSLADWIQDGRMYEGGKKQALARILDVAVQTAWGLQYAHEQGLVHQDIKPANILMTSEGQPKVTDFGLVGARGAEGISLKVKEGTVNATWGGMTPEYCSPEQAKIAYLSKSGISREEWPKLSRRTDIWSWAATVFEMFLGGRQWMVGQAAGYTLQEYENMKESLPEDVPEMPKPVKELLSLCFAEDETLRPATMVAASDALVEIYGKGTGNAYPKDAPKATKLRAATLNNRAVSLYDLGKIEDAERIWGEALADEPYHPESSYNLGLIQWRTGRLTDIKMKNKLQDILKHYPSEWIPQYLLAQALMEQCDFENAAGILEKLKSEYPKNNEIEIALNQAKRNISNTIKCLHRLEGHKDIVNSICMSADGHYALSGSRDKTLRFWDTLAGRCLHTLEGYSTEIGAVCLSMDSRYALAGDYIGTLKLWDTRTGECLLTFEKDTGCVVSICMSADGRYAFSGTHEMLNLWDVTTGKCLRKFYGGHTGWFYSVCMSVDGHYALSGSEDGTLKQWDISTGECLRTFAGHTAQVKSVCMSADGRYALSGSYDQSLRLWDITNGKCLRTFEGHGSRVNSVCMSADGRYALSGSGYHSGGYNDDKTLKLWDVMSGQCLHTIKVHSEDITSVCMSADGRYALSGSWDKTLGILNIDRKLQIPAPLTLSRLPDTQKIISEQLIFENYLEEALQKGEQGDFLGKYNLMQKARSGSGWSVSDDFIKGWSGLYTYLPKKGFLSTWQVKELKGHSNSVGAVCMSADGQYALSGSYLTLGLWEISTGRCLRKFKGHTGNITSVCISADGRYALSGSKDKTLKLWEIATGECVNTFEGHTGWITSVCMSADGRYALSGGSLGFAPSYAKRNDETLRLWDITTGKCMHTFKGHISEVTSICMSADGRYVLSGSAKMLRLWEFATGNCLRTFDGHTGDITSVCFSADGRYILSGSGDRTLRFWDVSTGKCLRIFEGHTYCVTSVFMNADGRYAISGSGTYDKTLKLWDIATGKCLYTFEGHTGGVNSVCMSTDSRYILSGSDDETLRLWSLYWDLNPKEPAEWDEGAKPYLLNFLILHTPYTWRNLVRKGKPTWTEDDFQKLLYDLGCAGYGWLRPGGVRAKLIELASKMKNG